MYIYEEKRKDNRPDEKRRSPLSAPCEKKYGQNVRYSPVVQKNIVHGKQGFYADKNRIAIKEMPVIPGMDRSHTISDRTVQEAVANWMNRVIAGSGNTDGFLEFCRQVAGEDNLPSITEFIFELNEILHANPLDVDTAVAVANQLYAAVANSRYNLRPGSLSGNRSTGNCIDLNGAEIVNVLNNGSSIVIKVSQVDGAGVDRLIKTGIPALVRVKAPGVVVSSTDDKFPGHVSAYQIIYVENTDDGFSLLHANFYK